MTDKGFMGSSAALPQSSALRQSGNEIDAEFTKERIQSMRDCELRSLVRSTRATSQRFGLQIVWARDEIARRDKVRFRNPHFQLGA